MMLGKLVPSYDDEQTKLILRRFYHWQLSLGVLQLLTKAASESAESETDPDPALLAKFREHQAKADIYHAYHHVRRYVEEPFTSLMPEDIFHMSRFVVQSINKVARCSY